MKSRVENDAVLCDGINAALSIHDFSLNQCACLLLQKCIATAAL
jgi:hypothetical protein